MRGLPPVPSHERALRLSEENYRMLADTLSDALYDWDLVTDTVIWSDALYREFKYAPGSIGTLSQWWVDRVHPDDRGRVLEAMADLFRRRHTKWEAEYRFQYGDGTYSIVIDRAAVMYDDQGQAIRAVEAGTSNKPAPSATILLVEDETPVRQLVAEVLRKVGYTVIEARDGSEGIRCVEEHAASIDLLLTDVVMPGVSGLAVAKALTTTGRATPAVFMSGYSEEFAAGTQALDAPLLQKPFTPARLVKAVRRALDRRPS